MVVLAVAILNTTGKILLSRQFVDMTRIRIESLLAAFPKLLGPNVEHTYVETDNVRYVYHPLESMFLLCITNKGSNIIEDLATLQMLSKVVPITCGSLTEEAVLENGFDLIFAFDEVITGGGYKVGLSLSELKTNLTMESHEEQLQLMIKESKIEEAHANMLEASAMISSTKGSQPVGKYAGMGSSSTSDSMSGLGGGGISMSYLNDSGHGMNGISNGYAHENTGSSASSSSLAFGGSSPSTSSYSEPTPAAAPIVGLSLGGPSKNASFLKAMAADDNVSSSFYEKNESQNGGNSGAATLPIPAAPRGPSGDVEISCMETIRVHATREGELESMEVKGSMTLMAQQDRAGLATIKFGKRELSGLKLQPNPILDRKALAQNVIRPRAPTKPFPVGSKSSIIKWRFNTTDKQCMPLSVNLWPDVGSRSTTVSVEYTLENVDMVLHDVCICIPLGSSSVPDVTSSDGIVRHVSKNDTIEWRHELVDEENATGVLEFVLSGVTDEEEFFPCTVQFSSNYSFANFTFEAAVDAEKGALKVVSENSMTIAEYTVQ
jgi:hypothetical protein